jgi:hypothetical protein
LAFRAVTNLVEAVVEKAITLIEFVEKFSE